MKPFIRPLAVGIAAAMSVGVATLAGCQSTDVAEPGTRRVATFTLEFKRPSDACACAQASPPATGPDSKVAPNPVASRQTADAGRPAFLPQPLSNGTAAPEPDMTAFPEAVTPSRPISTGTSAAQDTQTATRPVEDQSSVASPPVKSAPETSAKDLLPAESSSSSKRTFAVESPSMGEPLKNAPVLSIAKENHASLADPVFRAVNSKHIELHFEVRDKGPAGIAGVELWYIHENREWQRPQARLQKQGPYVLEVDGEGLYGFKLIARNSPDGGEPPPQARDLPQAWVLVDLTKPVVKINSAKVVHGTDGPMLELSWTATDKHLAHRPVTLLYAEQPEGPWLQMAANLESKGTCLKRLSNMPKRFLVRAEAIDIAGNVGADQTREFVGPQQTASHVSILKID